jgi:hypothetical protein
MVLVGAEVNAALARAAEERKETKIVRPPGTGEQTDTQLNHPTG